MFRHWIIRSIFITLLLLSMGAWITCHFFCHFDVYYNGNHGRWMVLGDQGVITLTSGTPFSGATGFFYHIDTRPEKPPFNGVGKHALGFSAGTDVEKTIIFIDTFVGIPFWFITALSAIILILVWRKARPKPTPATAFPVEIKVVSKVSN